MTESDHSNHVHPPNHRCPACSPPPETTPEDLAAIASDPGTRSLSRALAMSFTLLKILFLLLVVFFLLERVTYIEEGQVALIRRFGAYLLDPSGRPRIFEPGSFVFVWPSPIESLEILPRARERSMTIETEFWPRIEKKEKVTQGEKALPVMQSLDPTNDRYHLTGDQNLMHSQWKVTYRVEDFLAYRLAAEDPEAMVRALVVSVILRAMGGISIDDAYYYKKDDLFRRIEEDAKSAVLDPTGRPRWGIRIVHVLNTALLPPGAAQEAFDAVTGALSERTRLIDQARKEAEARLEDAKREADKVRREAEAYATRVRSEAAADAERLTVLLKRFAGDPQGLRIYLEQWRSQELGEILQGMRLYLLPRGSNVLWTGPDPTALVEETETEK